MGRNWRRIGVTWAALLLSAAAAGQPDATDPAGVVRYDGDALVRVRLDSTRAMRVIAQLSPDPWSHQPVNGLAEYRIPAANMEALRESGIEFEVLVEDLQRNIDAENARLRAAPAAPAPDAAWFNDFKNLAAIEAYMDELIALRPDLVTPFAIGQSIEGRTIRGIRITGAPTGRCKPGFFINGTQHAREWISPMNVVYYADRFVRDYDSDPAIRDLVDRVEFHIVPLANPDGYVYSWTSDRFWRKNRRNNGGGIFGVDNNRNWGHAWGTLTTGNGGSSNPSSQVYFGTGPFSEPENQAVRDYVLATPNIRTSNDVHSYGQLILHPWTHTSAASPDDALFGMLGQAQRSAILAVHGRSYAAGRGYLVLYPHAGTATDWFYAGAGVFSFSFELRGPGFDPPPSEILPCAQETFEAVKYMAAWIADEFPFIADWNHDCVYDLFDFLAYSNSFAAGEPEADLNGDGVLDLFDFLAFVNLFNAGR